MEDLHQTQTPTEVQPKIETLVLTLKGRIFLAAVRSGLFKDPVEALGNDSMDSFVEQIAQILTGDKREYIVGYADGVIAARASSMEQCRQTASGRAN